MNGVVVRAGAGGKGWFILRRNTRLERRKQQSAREETEERDVRLRTRSAALLTTTCTAGATAQARKEGRARGNDVLELRVAISHLWGGKCSFTNAV
ncbi:unnamed protein product [Sphagnum balticum]